MLSRRIAAAALAVTLVGCATARNYLDPTGPVFAGGSAVGGPARGTLRVVTFNIKWGEHVGRAVDLLTRPGPLSDADLFVLEEMDRPGTERIAGLLGLGYVYVPSAVHPIPRHDFGVALLSPWPLEAPRKILLPHQSRFRKLRRSAVVATLRSPLGPVRVYGVHLEAPIAASNGVRREQARAILADAADWPGPVVVAGDFNGRAGADELSKGGFSWVTREVKNTVGLLDLDHIVVRGLCPAGSRAAAAVPDETHASDHKPVFAVLAPCPAG